MWPDFISRHVNNIGMTPADISRLADDLRKLPLAEIQKRLEAIDKERDTLLEIRRVVVKAQRVKRPKPGVTQ